jgi:hypothetical protein
MSTFRSFTVLAALSLAGAAYAQTQATPDPQTTPPSDRSSAATPNANPDPSSAATHQRGATHMAAAGKRGVSWGMTVQTPSGNSLGKVAAVVPSTSSSGSYVVIATSTGSATAVPYSTASAMVKDNVLVMDKARLQNAPKVQQDQIEDGSSKAWQDKADKYWSKQGSSPDTSQSPDQASGPPR